MPGQRVREFLEKNGVEYMNIMHTPAYTAQGTAHAVHISGKEIAKTVILKVDDTFIMAVVPANRRVILELVMDLYGAKNVELASEEEFKILFPDCEIGAMPPFGNLYQMDIIVSEELTRDKEIAFNAGTHTELIRMDFRDYMKLLKPKIHNFTTQ